MIFLHLDCASSERIPLGIRIFPKGEDWNESVNFIICMIIMGVTASQENLEEVQSKATVIIVLRMWKKKVGTYQSFKVQQNQMHFAFFFFTSEV